jgi:hypothetical protein
MKTVYGFLLLVFVPLAVSLFKSVLINWLAGSDERAGKNNLLVDTIEDLPWKTVALVALLFLVASVAIPQEYAFVERHPELTMTPIIAGAVAWAWTEGRFGKVVGLMFALIGLWAWSKAIISEPTAGAYIGEWLRYFKNFSFHFSK